MESVATITSSDSKIMNKVCQLLIGEFPNDFVESCIESYSRRILLLDKAKVKEQLLTELRLICKTYGVRKEIPTEVYLECIKLIMEKFSFLAIHEIKTAYRQFAAGEIQSPGGVMYGGHFSTANLGAVLRAYSKKRNRVIRTYLQEKTNQVQIGKELSKKQLLQQKFDTDFPKMLQQAKKGMTDWRKIPHFWYGACENRNLIKVTPREKREVMKLAEQFLGTILKERNELKQIIEPTSPQEIIIANAKRLLVWSKVLGKELPKIQN